MEKLNLLEKLKTLKQWQLQQQMSFTKLKTNNESSFHKNTQNNDENKENVETTQSEHVEKNWFAETMTSRSLSAALQQINLNEGDMFAEEKRVETQDLCDDTIPHQMLGSGELHNWCLSGLQTVVMQNGVTNSMDIERLLQRTPDMASSSEEDHEIIESEDEFSEVEMNQNIDGIHPLVETEDENEAEGMNSHTAVSNDYVVEDNESESDDEEVTVIEQDFLNNDEKPIKSVATEGRNGLTFEELIEQELQKDKQTFASTPMKKKTHTFLKRGEGLQRFQCGNLYLKRKKKTVESRNHQNPTCFVRTTNKPGLPSKLRLRKNGETKIAKNNAIHIKNVQSQAALTDVRHIDSEHIDDISLKSNILSQAKHQAPLNEQYNKFDYVNGINIKDSVSSSILEASFQKMLRQYSEQDKVENEELDMFEALEEAAENVSLSSNTSLVAKLLGKKKDKQKVSQFRATEEEDNVVEQIEEDDTEADKASSHLFDFEDETSWSDTSQISSFFNENDDTIVHEPTPPKRIISKRKIAEDDKMEHEKVDIAQGEADVIRLQNGIADDISDTVKKKLTELEDEINKFRLENENLSRLRTERENEVTKLRKEIETFQKEKKEELERIEIYRDDEMKKLKTERKVFEKYQKACRAAPNKKERDEIITLKKEVSSLKEELKSRESRWNSASHRFRTRITELEELNDEMREEISVLEKERLRRRKENAEVNEKKIENRVSIATSQLCYHLVRTSPSSLQASVSSMYAKQQPQIPEPDIPIWSPNHNSEYRESNSNVNKISPSNVNNNSSNSQRKSNTEIRYEDGKVEVILPDMSRLITFPNGTRKTISEDERTVSVAFFNGDVKRTLPDGRVVYFYAESQTTHTTFPDGLEMLEFPNKQIEKRYTDGRTEIVFPDQTVKYISPNLSEDTVFTDGTVQRLDEHGVRTITFPNGQKEIHTKQYKRREYPNGTVKTVFEDGRQETKYSNGRLRVKDKEGNLLVDTGVS